MHPDCRQQSVGEGDCHQPPPRRKLQIAGKPASRGSNRSTFIILSHRQHTMQQPLSQNRHIPRTFTRKLLSSTVACGFTALLVGAGCSEESGSSITTRAGEGIALSISCADAAFLAAISPAAQSWATRTGARVELRSTAMTPGDDCDIGLLSVPEIGSWANRGELARIPGKLRFADHPFQWTGVLSIYREQLSEWGGHAGAR